ncbi:adenosine deaminase [Polynucleobacter sphagniphilus]|jgi:adenosine deaminase/adenosine deaminase CECR1|uniref:adenosine deaminase n=1 Tax=Polynucleobacter sphagniphilus TaxID=1743169 RepID=A0AA43S5P7_9BURK|nr:adenosine deaminase [Polynucleobacter sphagniphilus]MDH6503607.1 adenosine deaminase [Polynucleobacter sphagniphilus]MDH6512840.1 adenosine deaminase [Polynucleobacter sphagniphilus]
MIKIRAILLIFLVNLLPPALAQEQNPGNLAKTRSLYSKLLNQSSPDVAGITLFANLLPKGADLHHHFSGSIYAETYLDWVKENEFCIFNETNASLKYQKFKVSTDPKKLTEEQRVACLSVDQVLKDNLFYRDLLMEWSSKDYANHFHIQTPPDKHFFDTFRYFENISPFGYGAGLKLLKERALQENVSYLETMLKSAPANSSPELANIFKSLGDKPSELQIQSALIQAYNQLQNNSAAKERINGYVQSIENISEGMDDENFRLRFLAYASRNSAPDVVFSRLYGAFIAATSSKKIVGVNIVGAENNYVAMRDYDLHMKMLAFLKTQYPKVKLSLHAGELVLGMVPPEGLRTHINQAVRIAGASRIGHGIDIPHETNAPDLLSLMARNQIALEVNSTSNKDILGVKSDSHPISIYKRFKVPFVISTDDSGISRNNLSGEYQIYITSYRPSYEELKSTVRNSIRYSFLTDSEKQEELKKLDKRFLDFEARMSSIPQ